MITKPTMNANLIAPCGINCGVCVAYLRDKNKCPSCRAKDKNKPKTRTCCKIKNCEELKKKKNEILLSMLDVSLQED